MQTRGAAIQTRTKNTRAHKRGGEEGGERKREREQPAEVTAIPENVFAPSLTPINMYLRIYVSTRVAHLQLSRRRHNENE